MAKKLYHSLMRAVVTGVLLTTLGSVAFADSRSVTVRVSCIVPERLTLSSSPSRPQEKEPSATAGKIHTVTAL